MSRSGYSCNLIPWDLIRWRGAVNSAMRGRRGQSFLRKLIAALDSLPDKRLISTNFQSDCGVCALGAVAQANDLDVADLEPAEDAYDNEVDQDMVAERFGIARALACETMFVNDEAHCYRTDVDQDQHRWQVVRNWAQAALDTSG